jgi:hypothetical protein
MSGVGLGIYTTINRAVLVLSLVVFWVVSVVVMFLVLATSVSSFPSLWRYVPASLLAGLAGWVPGLVARWRVGRT